MMDFHRIERIVEMRDMRDWVIGGVKGQGSRVKGCNLTNKKFSREGFRDEQWVEELSVDNHCCGICNSGSLFETVLFVVRDKQTPRP